MLGYTSYKVYWSGMAGYAKTEVEIIESWIAKYYADLDATKKRTILKY